MYAKTRFSVGYLYKNLINVCNNSINDDSNPQSKVKESKVNKSIVKEIKINKIKIKNIKINNRKRKNSFRVVQARIG